MAAPGPLFALNFIGHSYPIFEPSLTRVDQTHWTAYAAATGTMPAASGHEGFRMSGPVVYVQVLDVCPTVLNNYWDLKELVVFLVAPGVLDPNLALGVYVRTGGSDWVYRGCVHAGHPSEVMPLQWPQPESGMVSPGPGAAQIGISVEPAAEVIPKEGSKLGAREDFAKRVALNLFHFMESFQTRAMGDQILVPANCIDRWFLKFQEKFRRDPDFLTRDQNPI